MEGGEREKRCGEMGINEDDNKDREKEGEKKKGKVRDIVMLMGTTTMTVQLNIFTRGVRIFDKLDRI